MQTGGKKPSARPATSSLKDRDDDQLKRFKEMAIEVGADESPDALDRAFGRIDATKKIPVPTKRKKKVAKD
jgi:hypothetical protein